MLPSRSRPSSHVYTWNPRMHPCCFLFPPLLIQSICKFPCLHPLRASLISHFPPSPPYPIPVPTKPRSSVTWTPAIDPAVFPYCFLPLLLIIYFQHYNYSQSHLKKLELGRFSLSLKTPKGLAMSLGIKPPVLSMALGGLCDLAFPVSPVSSSITLLFVCTEHCSALHFHSLERAMPSPSLRTLHMLLSVCNVLALTPVLEIPAEMPVIAEALPSLSRLRVVFSFMI